MTPERWEKLKELCALALEREPKDRISFLEKSRLDDSDLLRDAQSMIARATSGGGVLDGPIWKDFGFEAETAEAVQQAGELEAEFPLARATTEATVIGSYQRLQEIVEGGMVVPNVSPGQTLGHFRLIEKIGAGGMGIVYRAWDTRLERDVAVKVLNATRLSDVSDRKRFRREAFILSRFNHPNIASVYDFHSDHGVDYLVMEYVPGTSLDKRVEHGALSEKDVLALGVQLASGLAAAHAQQFLHRDLKPGNLRVTTDNVLKILDFGLAQLFVLPGDKTADHVEDVRYPLAGTLAYLSPEQLQLKEPDNRSDIYAAGVVLYQLVTGVHPFPQRGSQLADAILHSVPPAPRSKNKKISRGMEVAILKCMEKDPGLRYQSANGFLSDLKELWSGSEPRRAPVLKHELVSPRYRVLRFVVSGVCLTLFLSGLGLLFQNFTVIGQELQTASYRLIQHRLSSAVSKPLPVTVVDISDLEPKLVPGTDSKATPRLELQQMLEAIAAQNPSAIGIDIDFSADENGWIDPVHDPQFLEACLALKGPTDRRIPVVSGNSNCRDGKGLATGRPAAASAVIM